MFHQYSIVKSVGIISKILKCQHPQTYYVRIRHYSQLCLSQITEQIVIKQPKIANGIIKDANSNHFLCKNLEGDKFLCTFAMLRDVSALKDAREGSIQLFIRNGKAKINIQS